MSHPVCPAAPEALLSVAEMGAADAAAIAGGRAGIDLMEAAGGAVADAICERFERGEALVLCGPGNNGGDGYVAARLLAERGWQVRVESLIGTDRLKGDAALAAGRWRGPVAAAGSGPMGEGVIIDALFGAGLSKPLAGFAADFAARSAGLRRQIVSVDVPSGVDGSTGLASGPAVEAALTVTFFRRKPGHLLYPARGLCGEVVCADIGIPAGVLQNIRPRTFVNGPGLWRLPVLQPSGHKYSRGHALIVGGGPWAGGAARLAARGALRAGAGLVTLASPFAALPVNAAHLNAIMLAPCEGAAGLDLILEDKRKNAVALGPGLGLGEATRDMAEAALRAGAAVTLDADALTAFQDEPARLFRHLHDACVMTPHEGEFERLFPGLLAGGRLAAARTAAARAGCVVVLKGPDTVIAAPDGQAAINENAPPWLATAGAGDVLAGFICGLTAQGMSALDAACAGVWLHGAAAAQFGRGLIAEDLPEGLPAVFAHLG